MASTSPVIKILGGPFAVALLALAFLVPSANAGPQSDKSDISLRTVPERPIAGQEIQLAVSIIDKDSNAATNVPVTIICEDTTQSGGHAGGQHQSSRFTTQAKPAGKDGEYVASLMLPSAGEWKVTVAQGDRRAEFKLNVLAQSGQVITGAGGNEKEHDAAGSSAPAGLQITHAIGNSSLTVSSETHPRAGAGITFAFTVADRQSATPTTGLNVEIIPVRLPEGKSDGHGKEADTEHHGNSTIRVVVARERTDVPGRYEAKYTFPEAGSYALLLRTSAAQDEFAEIPITVEGAAGHGAETVGPNYWFVGTLLAILGITIAVVAILRQREQGIQQEVG